MANSYSAPNFVIDTNIDVAGLATLKGSAVATTDNIYIHNAATLNINANLSINYIYLGDNVGGTAVTKRGFTIGVTNGITLTANTTIANGGFTGKGTTSSWTFGAGTVTSGTAQNCGWQVSTAAGNPIYANGTTFLATRYMRGWSPGGNRYEFRNCTWTDCLYCWLVSSTDPYLPNVFQNCTITGATYSFVNNTANLAYDFADFFKRWMPKITGDNTAGNALLQNLNFGTTSPITRYIVMDWQIKPKRWYRKLGR